jgi:hypothetical protein
VNVVDKSFRGRVFVPPNNFAILAEINLDLLTFLRLL